MADSAGEIASKVRARQVSAVEVVQSAIDRIEASNADLNAFVILDADGAIKRASQLDRRIAGGEAIGPLAGVPTAYKDLFSFYPGWPSTFGGIPALSAFALPIKSRLPQKLEDAGAIVLGATNSPVLGFRGTCDNLLFGPTRNPFDRERNSGGSSGGSAAAVAAGFVPIAGAGDGGGSIRIPAAWSGVYGFQPSFGRVSFPMRPNAFGATTPFLFEGPVSRTVADAALMISILAGFDPSDPFSREDNVDWMGAIHRPLRGMRIGVTADFGDFPVDHRIVDLLDKTAATFAAGGAVISQLEITPVASHRQLADLWCRMIAMSTAGALAGLAWQGIDLLRDFRSELPEDVIHWLEIAQRQNLAGQHADQILRTQILDQLGEIFGSVDLILSPTTSCLPVINAARGETVGPPTVEGEAINQLIGFCLTFFTNFTGNPAASMPAGMIDGLPVGVQLIGRRLADADVLAASAAFEQLSTWQDIYAQVKLHR